jgi:hypothetical protein
MAVVERELPDASMPAPPAATSADAIPLGLRRRGGSPRQVLAMTAIGTLVLAVFASHDLSRWLDRFGGGPLLEPLQQAAATWDSAMEGLGLTAPAETLRTAMRRLLDARWTAPP